LSGLSLEAKDPVNRLTPEVPKQKSRADHILTDDNELTSKALSKPSEKTLNVNHAVGRFAYEQTCC
jgi:hypothetical protein